MLESSLSVADPGEEVFHEQRFFLIVQACARVDLFKRAQNGHLLELCDLRWRSREATAGFGLRPELELRSQRVSEGWWYRLAGPEVRGEGKGRWLTGLRDARTEPARRICSECDSVETGGF